MDVTGTPGNDSLTGTEVEDVIRGLAGNDTLIGLGGNDTLDGGTGVDLLRGGAGDDTLVHVNLNDPGLADTLDGGLGDDTYDLRSPDLFDDHRSVLEDDGGEDTVLVNHDFTLPPGFENLTSFLGEDESNRLTGNALNNVITSMGEHDVIDGAEGNDTMAGGEGGDSFVFRAAPLGDYGQDVIDGGGHFGGEGVDTLIFDGARGGVIVDLRAGTATGSGISVSFSNIEDVIGSPFADRLTAHDGVEVEVDFFRGARLTGGGGNDTLIGGASTDELSGGTGNDDIRGGAGDDTLDAGTGGDRLAGSTGNDIYIVDGPGDTVVENLGEGTDTVLSSATRTLDANVENLTLTGTAAINGTGNALNNAITGNSANNVLNAGTGGDRLAGGRGNDTYIVDGPGDTVIESAGEGTDTVQSSASRTLDTEVENLTLSGSAAINGTGNALNNRITGNSSANSLAGGAGNDRLEGRRGNDSLTGGTGADQFVFLDAPSSGGVDRVTDFVRGTDELLFENSAFTALGASGAMASGDGRFRSGAGVTTGRDTSDRLVYNTSTGNLYYDADGSGSGGSVLIANFAGNPTLSASDITVI